MSELDATALVVIDLQRAFDDLDAWSPNGHRDNPDCEANVARLVAAWHEHGRPLVLVRHDSVEDGSPLAPGTPGNAFKPELDGVEPDLLVTKDVNAAFFGEPDLAAWLRDRGLARIAVCGIQTNHCVETTARVGGNLGFDVLMVADACHTFDRLAPDGSLVTAEELTRATLTSLHGEFATVVSTGDLV
jgi:nicotinamidase-related amidase